MTISRRNFLKVAGAAGGVLLAGGATSAQGAQAPQTSAGGVEFNGMLIDTTKCIGCRACEEACNEANKLPKPKVSFSTRERVRGDAGHHHRRLHGREPVPEREEAG